MPIVSSSVIEDRPQRDGRRAVREQHADHLGRSYFATYLADAGADLAAPLAARAAQISADLTANEIAANLANAMNQVQPTFNYSTTAQNVANLRAVYSTLTQWQACCLGNFLNGLGLTAVQLQNIFGVTAGAQTTALQNRLANQAAAYAAAIAQVGQ